VGLNRIKQLIPLGEITRDDLIYIDQRDPMSLYSYLIYDGHNLTRLADGHILVRGSYEYIRVIPKQFEIDLKNHLLLTRILYLISYREKMSISTRCWTEIWTFKYGFG
jgi:hypothetical protein